MDVEDPKLTTRACLWNAYYVFMLKDQGGFFNNYEQFNKVLKAVYKHKKIDTKKVSTIKGHYMLAVVK